MKVEKIVASNLLEACSRITEIKSGPETLILLTTKFYEELEKVGSELNESYRYGDQVAANLVKSYRVYSIHTLRTTNVRLVQGTAWTALVEFDYKEFSAKVGNNLYVVDIEQ